jgi:hypothetical protein
MLSVNPPSLTWECMNKSLLYLVCIVHHGTRAHLKCVLHKSLPSVCMSVCASFLSFLCTGSVKCTSSFVATQRLGKHVPAAMNIRNNRRVAGRVCLWLCLCIPLSLLCNNSVKTFSRRKITVGGAVFYAARVVSKESSRLVLLRTSCS